jgi:O-antigen/teichoic acid export membrane protein
MDTNVIEINKIIRKLFSGSGFRMGSFIFGRIIQLIRIMVFARLFTPNDIGTNALVISIVSVISILADFGFNKCVIRQKDESQSFANTVFTTSLFLGISVLILTIIVAPIFSKVFKFDIANYVRFLAFLPLVVPLNFPQIFWEKKIEFMHPSIAQVIPQVTSLFVSIFVELSYKIGIWSMLIGYAAGFFLTVIYIWIFADYRPKIEVNPDYLKQIFQFGTPIMIQGLNDQVMVRGDNFFVGAYFNASQLAYYNFAWQLPMMISLFSSMIDSMFLPVYSRLHHDKKYAIRLFNYTNKFWSISGSFIGFFLIIFAKEIVDVLYGPQWQSVVPILKIMTISFIFRFCTGYSYDNLVIVRGRTQYMMKWGFVNTFFVLTLGWYMIKNIGPIGGAWFWLIQALILIPLIRLPLIYQELQTFEFLNHVWQPVLSGLVTTLLSYFLILIFPNMTLGDLSIRVLCYLATYPIMLIILDSRIISDVKQLVTMAKQ